LNVDSEVLCPLLFSKKEKPKQNKQKDFDVSVIKSSIPLEEREKKVRKWIRYFCFENEKNNQYIK
jgi:hypothetical protein